MSPMRYDQTVREESEDDGDVRAAWLNKRVRSFAGVLRASLSRVGCAASEDDLRAECATLVDRLKRFVAEGGAGEHPHPHKDSAEDSH